MLRVGGGTTQSTKKSRVISKRNRHEMQFAPRGKNCVAASRFRLSRSPEKLHPNDSNIFAKFFRGIFEIFSRRTLSRTPCGKRSIFCTDAGNYTRLKYFRGYSENISQKYLSRLGGFFQENDSSEIGKPPHNFFPAEQIASNSRFLLRLREIVFPAIFQPRLSCPMQSRARQQNPSAQLQTELAQRTNASSSTAATTTDRETHPRHHGSKGFEAGPEAAAGH